MIDINPNKEFLIRKLMELALKLSVLGNRLEQNGVSIDEVDSAPKMIIDSLLEIVEVPPDEPGVFNKDYISWPLWECIIGKIKIETAIKRFKYRVSEENKYSSQQNQE